MKADADLGLALQQIVEQEIVQRFGRLSDAQIGHKADGELVTEADTAAEWRISALLRDASPASVVIGEEAVSADPALASKADGPAVWIVDPLDSTMNFRAGDPDFSTLVAYCEAGTILRSWTIIPMKGIIAYAERGAGAFINGKPASLTARNRAPPVIAVTHPAFRTEADEDLLSAIAGDDLDFRPARGAGLEYVALVTGEIDGCIFTWQKPWDHAAGALLVKEAGGHHSDSQGRAFDLRGRNALPLIAACNPALFQDLHARVDTQASLSSPTIQPSLS